jgi:methyl-accepting chemotaxis protein
MAKDDMQEALLSQLQRYRTMAKSAGDSLLWNGIRQQIEILEAKLARLQEARRAALAEAEADERRSSDRVAAKISGRLARGDRNFLIETVDLSEGGALLLAKGARGLVKGDPVKLDLSGIGEIKGEVVARSREGLHLRFLEDQISPRDRLLHAIERIGHLEGKFIDAAQSIAAEIGAAFESAVAKGDITYDDLFDTNYRPIAGTKPEQYLTNYAALAEQVLPPIQEPALRLDESVVFCTAIDQNGYLPADNCKFLRRPTVGATVASRHRRIADDAVSLAAARNRRAFLLQSYEDRMKGKPVHLKEVDSPITITGRHWGGLRLAFHL